MLYPPNAGAKLHRAREHIYNFNALSNEFIKYNFKTIHKKNDLSGAEETYASISAPPQDVVCTAGDAIHNLGSALDQVVFPLAVRSGLDERMLRHVYFTARESSDEFKAALTEPRVCTIGKAWVEFLIRHEPYRGGKGENLWRLKALDNIDKHRALLSVPRWLKITPFNETGLVRAVNIPFEEGVPLKFPAWANEPDAAFTFHPYVAFDDVATAQVTEAIIELRLFAEGVERVLIEAAREFF